MRYCPVLRVLVLLFAVLQVLYLVCGWLLPEGHVGPVKVDFFPKALSAAEVAALPAGERWSGALLALPATASMLYGLWRLDAMLRAFTRGEMFTTRTIA